MYYNSYEFVNTKMSRIGTLTNHDMYARIDELEKKLPIKLYQFNL